MKRLINWIMEILYHAKNYEPVIVYSIRRIVPEYTGYLFRIRRSSDNAELDIGFDANGDLDVVTLMTFVGSGDGFVKIWYDQSGNNYHQQQLTTISQPPIVESGTLVTLNSKPAVRFTSPYRLLTVSELPLNIVINADYKNTVFLVFNATAYTNGAIVGMENVISRNRYFIHATHTYGVPGQGIFYDVGNFTTRRIYKIAPDPWLNIQWLMTNNSNGSLSKIYLNSSMFQSGAVSGDVDLTETAYLCIGNYITTEATIHTGLIQEVIIYDDYIFPYKRISIENKIKTYYGIS